MFEHRSKLLGLSCLAHDLALALVAFSLAYWIRDQLLPRLDSTSFQPIHPFAYYLPVLSECWLCGRRRGMCWVFIARWSYAARRKLSGTKSG